MIALAVLYIAVTLFTFFILLNGCIPSLISISHVHVCGEMTFVRVRIDGIQQHSSPDLIS